MHLGTAGHTLNGGAELPLGAWKVEVQLQGDDAARIARLCQVTAQGYRFLGRASRLRGQFPVIQQPSVPSDGRVGTRQHRPGQRELRVPFDRRLEHLHGAQISFVAFGFRQAFVNVISRGHEAQALQIQRIRFRILGRRGGQCGALGGCQCHLQRGCDALGDVSLQREQVVVGQVKGLRPDMRVRTRIDQLSVDHGAVAEPLHAALEDDRHTEFIGNHAQPAGPILITHDRRA